MNVEMSQDKDDFVRAGRGSMTMDALIAKHEETLKYDNDEGLDLYRAATAAMAVDPWRIGVPAGAGEVVPAVHLKGPALATVHPAALPLDPRR